MIGSRAEFPQGSEHEAVDVAILGGGVAGLWLLHRLSRAGHECRLVERGPFGAGPFGAGPLAAGPFGAGQTLRSQGILHRGTKYLLRPEAKDEFPDLWPRWREALAGSSDVDPDLRSVRVHAPGPELRSLGSLPVTLLERLEAARGRGLVERVGAQASGDSPQESARAFGDTPQESAWAFGDSPEESARAFGDFPEESARAFGDFPEESARANRFRLLEPVLDTADLLEALARPHLERCLLAKEIKIDVTASGAERPVRVETPGKVVQAKWLVLAAGAGNGDLLRSLGRDEPEMILRPLHMTWIEKTEGPSLPPLWCHVLDEGAAPGRPGAHFTITSHPSPPESASSLSASGLPLLKAGPRWRWYVGGDPSESGVDRDPGAQIELILRLLRRHFPEMRLDAKSNAQIEASPAEPSLSCWTQRVARAEPAHLDGVRRLEPFVHRQGCVLTVWPMKLALAPLLGDRVLEAL